MYSWSPLLLEKGREGVPKFTAKPLGSIIQTWREVLGPWGGAATCQLAVPSEGAARLGFCHVFVYLVWLMYNIHTQPHSPRACVQNPRSTLNSDQKQHRK